MSHNDQHHHLSSPGSAVPDSSSPTEYGVALPRPDTPFSHSPRGVLSTTDTSVAATDRAAAAVVDQGEAMQRDPDRITLMERWAINASDSQFHALAGAIGGFTSGIVTCPLDVIKTKLQAQGGFTAVQKGRHVGHQRIYKGLGGTASIIWKEEGLRGLYRGLGPIIMGYLPTWAVWFTVYNKSKIWMSQYQRKSDSVKRNAQTLTVCRKHICDQPLVFHYSRSQQYDCHEPDMGHQDTADVTSWASRPAAFLCVPQGLQHSYLAANPSFALAL